jgi:hypothetical protein
MMLEFPRPRVRHVSEVDAAPEPLPPGIGLWIIVLLSLALWALLIWGAIALCGLVNG